MAQLKNTTITGTLGVSSNITANEVTLTDDINAVNGFLSGTLNVSGTVGSLDMAGNIDMNGYDITALDQLYFQSTDIEILPTTTTNMKVGIGQAATADYQINIGLSNTGTDRSVIIGLLNNAAANYAVNIGYDADSGATKAVSIGYATDATAESNVAIGDTAQATGTDNAIAIGTATASGNKAIAIGELSATNQTSSIALGYSAKANGGYGCIAIGPNSDATGGSGFAMGYQSKAAAYGIGLGAGAESTNSYASALGFDTHATGISSLSIGAGTITVAGPTASGRNSIAIGGYNAVTTSVSPVASGVGAIAIGAGTINAVDYTFKVGGDIVTALFDCDVQVGTADSDKLYFGAGSDVSMYYNGSDMYIVTDLVAASDLNIDCGTDKTVVLTESVWNDIQFNVESGRVAAANFPDWDASFTTNTGCFKFDVDDYIDIGTNEMQHDWKEATDIYPHVHVALDGANASGSSQYVKFIIYIAYADAMAVYTETNKTIEIEVPDGTADLTHLLGQSTALAMTGLHIGCQLNLRLKRIAATTGTEYPNHIFVTQVGVHYEVERLGSRTITGA